MNEERALEKFRRQKIVTIAQLVEWLKCSVITVRRNLKRWQSLTSINKNGRYYTLPKIPVFDENGLWKYQTVLFSKHGNLKRTIFALITDSDKGLSAVEIAELVDLVANSSFLSRFKSVPGIRREKFHGRFIYFSDHSQVYSRQKQERAARQQPVGFPADSEAVEILVQLIKHPDIRIEQLAAQVSKPGKQIGPDMIRRFLRLHDLLKKTSATKQ
jgi:hypothetical protein